MESNRLFDLYLPLAFFVAVTVLLGSSSVLVALIYALGVTHAFLVGFTHGDSLRRGTVPDTYADHIKRQKQWEPGIYPSKPVSDTDPVRSASDRSSSSVISSEPYRSGSKGTHGDK